MTGMVEGATDGAMIGVAFDTTWRVAAVMMGVAMGTTLRVHGTD
jgi:hypothetical protein